MVRTKQSQIEKRSPFDDLTDAELDELEEYIAGMRAKTVAQLELVVSNEAAAIQPTAADEKDATQPIDETKYPTSEKSSCALSCKT